jgi:tetratricopeptide (TPR) repeat protein
MVRALASVVAALLFAGGGEQPRAPFAGALLSVAAEAGDGAVDEPRTLSELARIARLVRGAAAEGASRAEALNRTIFGTLGFVREVEDTSLRFVLLPSVLQGRRGSCVGLGTLYIALGEELGWKVEGVMVPGHFYVRVDEGTYTRNIELLRRGEEMPDAWYRERFAAKEGGPPEYRRPLTDREVLAVVEYDVGNERKRDGRLAEARRAFLLSSSLFPGLSEAHASLGATLHLLGELDHALASYQAARLENPGLPGVDRNIELLRVELEGRASDRRAGRTTNRD